MNKFHIGSAVALSLCIAAAARAESGAMGMDDKHLSVGWPENVTMPAQKSPVLTMDAAAPTAGGESEADLAKKSLNPVASMISLPIQYNGDFGIGPKDSHRDVLNIQPVIPISLNADWNLISRTIIPLTYRGSYAEGVDYKFGMGDISQSFFFSPVKDTNGWIWGAGPVFLFPTATDDSIGTQKWAAGPTVVALQQQSGWTYGILANHLWSFVGNDNRSEVNLTYLQPFVSYTFPTFTTLGLNVESTYDWTAKQWTLPINATVTQLLKVGGQPISLQLGGRYYAEGPSGGPDWGVRFAITFLFPR